MSLIETLVLEKMINNLIKFNKYNLVISHRVLTTNNPPLLNLGELASKTKNCITLGQGVPYYEPDATLLDEFYDSMRNIDYHRYTSDPGILNLRESLSRKFKESYQVQVDADQFTVTNGCNQAFVNTLITLTDPGDKVGLITPYYFNHQMACNLFNLEAVEIGLNPDYSLSLEKIESAINKGIKVLVLVNPGNPTGVVHSKEDLNLIADLIKDKDIWLICDETYEYFTYGNSKHITASSITKLQDKAVTLGSFSKTFGIPGWRLGYYFGPQNFIEESMKVQDTIGICAPALSQYFGNFLLKNQERLIPHFVKLMENNFNLAKDLLSEVSWLEMENGSGAYYLFPRQTSQKNSTKLAVELIENSKVAIIPGSSFGNEYQDYFRISFANVKEEKLKTAFSRLKNHQF